MPKMGQNSIISSFFAQRAKKAWAKGRSPPQELEVGPRSGPYLLVKDKYIYKWAVGMMSTSSSVGFCPIALITPSSS